MKKMILIISLLVLIAQTGHSQYNGNPLPQFPKTWNSQWITHPTIDKAAYGLIHFRNTMSIETLPEKFIVHVSADNRYRLYVNEVEVCYGPQLGDMRHWRYETLDLAPFLKKGKNIIAAEVINWGIERSYGIISFKTGFLLQGNSEKEYILNTGNNTGWKVFKNQGMYEKPVVWRGGGEIVGGFYAANPTDSIVASQYPWGWKEIAFNDNNWQKPEVIFAQPKVKVEYGHGWILQPRTTVIQQNKKEIFTRVVRSDLEGLDNNFQFGKTAVTIPANSRHNILIDQGYVTVGYPKLQLSQGKNARIKVRYSETLFDANNQKGNRNQLEGMTIKGMSDIYIMDGGENRLFQPLWFRAFRFIQLEIETGEENLRIDDYYNIFSASPIPVIASFKTNDSLYSKVWDLCWHTMKICAQDNLMSDAYYEQMQYVGDLRPHLMGYNSLTGDLSYFRSAIEQFNNSRLPDGNITSCYPLKATFVHPTYSLIWIDMLYDLMMIDGDKTLLKSYTGEIQEVFDYFESLINKNGLVGKSDYQMFIDWYLTGGGNSIVNKDGNSAILTLNYSYTLAKAAALMSWLGFQEKAAFYKRESLKYATTVRKLCFDAQRGIYSDDPEKTFYDQRASILAVLTGAHTESESKILLANAMNENTKFDSEANLFYFFYLFEAMKKTGVGDFTQTLKPWKAIAEMGMTATPEKRIEQNPRSEVHPWTSFPVHFYFNLVAGIQSASPGFKTVVIAPQPGKLEKIEAVYPTKHGLISMNITFTSAGNAVGSITLPPGINGEFLWKGKTIKIQEGLNQVRL